MSDLSLKQFRINLAYHFSELLEKPLAKPHWIYISLSHECTYKCKMCGVVKILKGYKLSTELIKKALDEIAQWQWNCRVTITGGEPFLSEDIFELFKYSVQKKVQMEVVSNGAFIDKILAKKIITSGIENIAISLDGAKESTHDFIRQKGSFAKAIKAIRHLVDEKKKNKIGPQLSVWTTIMKENVSELFDIIALVKTLGIECVVYHPVIVAQEDMQNTSLDAPFWLKEKGLDVLKLQIDKIVDYRNTYGMVAFLHDPYLWINHFKGLLTKKNWKCNPFVFINIGPDGNVRSCGAAFGNIKESSLTECLNTKQAKKARSIMKNCQKPCLQTCWAHPESDSLDEIAHRFLLNIRESDYDNQGKKELAEQGLAILSEYESLVSERKNINV